MNSDEAPRLISLRVSNGALKGDKLPERIKVLAWGVNESVHGPVTFDDASVQSLAANQRKLGFDRVALDYEHNTVPGSPEFERTREPREVAAHGTVEAVAGDGLYLSALTWTPSGQKNATNFEDLSLAPKVDATGRVVFVHSAALTHNGAVYDLSFYSANVPNPIKKPMSENAAPDLSALLIQLNTLTTRLEAVEKRPAPDLAPVTEQIKTLSAGIETLRTELQTRDQALQSVERDSLIKRFAADGKVPLGADGKPITDEDLKKLDLATLRMLHANTPVTVPLSARAGTPKAAADNGLKGRERVAAAINKDLATRGLI